MRRRISSLLLSWLIVGSLGSASAQPASPPTLVVVVVVDQMRADYVERFQHQWTSGLRRLVDKGAWFRQAAYPYFQTNTCVGHATIATGSLPETHGIIGNNWYDRTEGRLRACSDDAEWSLLSYGAPVEAAQGPGSLLVPTLGDELYAQGATEARVVSLSMKPRVAIMLAGHRANAVVWQQDRTWVTSTAYADATIPFVARFLEANPIERDHGAVWARTLPNEAYLFESNTPTSRPLEGWTGSFPHSLLGRGGSPDLLFRQQWTESPFSNEHLGRLAAAAIDALQLGQRRATDYLAVGFSALDWTGHHFGPRSHEVQDVLIRLDRTLGTLLDHLDRTVGTDSYVVALTADHGVMPIPEHRVTQRLDAGRIAADRIVAAAEEATRRWLGPGPHVAQLEEQDFYFARGVYDQLLARPDALEDVMSAIRSIEGVAKVFRAETISRSGRTGSALERALAHSYYPGRSGDLLVVLRTYWTTSTNAAGHGTSYGYDTRVPLLLMGPGILPGQYLSQATPADIAPTLAHLSHVTLAHADGRVLLEALGERKR